VQLSYGLRLPTDVRYVSVVRRLCVATMTELGVSEGCTDDIALAVTEACANVIQHAGTDDDFQVRVSVEGLECRIEVVDFGTGIPDASLAGLVVDPRDPLTHGRGIGIMRILVDELDFTLDAEGTTVVLVKRLDPAPGSVLARAAAPAG
jgi:serine/threonine-protein kinase RsbW